MRAFNIWFNLTLTKFPHNGCRLRKMNGEEENENAKVKFFILKKSKITES